MESKYHYISAIVSTEEFDRFGKTFESALCALGERFLDEQNATEIKSRIGCCSVRSGKDKGKYKLTLEMQYSLRSP